MKVVKVFGIGIGMGIGIGSAAFGTTTVAWRTVDCACVSTGPWVGFENPAEANGQCTSEAKEHLPPSSPRLMWRPGKVTGETNGEKPDKNQTTSDTEQGGVRIKKHGPACNHWNNRLEGVVCVVGTKRQNIDQRCYQKTAQHCVETSMNRAF